MKQKIKDCVNKLIIFSYYIFLPRRLVDIVGNVDCKLAEKKNIVRYLYRGSKQGAYFDFSQATVTFNFGNVRLSGPILDMSFYDVASEFQNDEYQLEAYDLHGKTVLDIGANIGDSALNFFSKGAFEVISLEPNKSLRSHYVRNLKENGFQNFTHYAFGLSENSEIIKAPYRPWASAGTTSKSELTMVHAGEWPTIELEMMSTSIFLEQYMPLKTVDVVKLDCEGSEYEIIAAEEFFSLKPELILIEYHFGVRNLVNLLSKNGYETRVFPKRDDLGLIFANKKTAT